jgi:hypothetical protein
MYLHVPTGSETKNYRHTVHREIRRIYNQKTDTTGKRPKKGTDDCFKGPMLLMSATSSALYYV